MSARCEALATPLLSPLRFTDPRPDVRSGYRLDASSELSCGQRAVNARHDAECVVGRTQNRFAASQQARLLVGRVAMRCGPSIDRLS